MSEFLKQYPPPKKEDSFVDYWESFIEDVATKKGFHTSHLKQLEVLCDLYVEYDVLTSFIREQGYVDTNINKYGETRKVSPYVIQRNKTVSEIRAYARLLGVLSEKQRLDEGDIPKDAESEDDWS